MARILIVDDHEPNRELVASLAGYLGHLVLEAADGAEALHIVCEERPELVICDLVMPVMDGYEFVRQVRNSPDIANTEIIFYTANYREEEARSLARQLGVKRIIFKPCVPEDVLEAIEASLKAEDREQTVGSVRVDDEGFEAEHTRVLTDALSRKSDELEKANRRLAALTEINLQLSGMRDAGRMLETICRDARVPLGASYCILCVNESHNSEQQVRVFLSGFSQGSEQALPCPDLDQGIPGEVLRQRSPRRISSGGSSTLSIGLPQGYPLIRSCVVSPIMSTSRVYGWVCLINRLDGNDFSEEDEWLCSSHAAMAGRVYENRSLYLQLESRARQLQLYDRAIGESSNGIVICRADKEEDNPIIYANRAFTHMTGYAHEEVMGLSPRFLLADDWAQPELDRLRHCMRFGGSARVILRNYRKDGRMFWNEVAMAAVHDETEEVSHFISVFNDVTERKRYEAALEYQANYDALTGLPNRNLLQDRLTHAISRADREGTELAVLLIDLDQFKRVNDGLGHNVGDVLIQKVATRMDNCVRDSDTVARLGGDELLRNADAAMYRVKELGRNGMQFYSSDMNTRMRDRLSLEQSLRSAIHNRELSLWYQPKLDLASGRIYSAEALLRWHHPDRGMVSPAEFIPVAEESGLILPTGAWVIEESTRQIDQWHRADKHDVGIAINISAHQFSHGRLAEQVQQALERLAIPPERLTVEVTETAIMTHMDVTLRQLQTLRDIGVTVALDDFGTGYSSLTYLKHFPTDILKIDRSFVTDIASDAQSGAIVDTIIKLAHNLDMRVVAEGVETREQLEFLKAHGCDEIQGFLFSKPLPARDFLALLHRH
jgi:PAS domain S-box-containing protein